MKKIITIFLGVCISIFFVSCSTPYYNQNSDLPNANNTKDFIHYEVEFDIPNEYTAYSTDNEFYTELIINDNIDVKKKMIIRIVMSILQMRLLIQMPKLFIHWFLNLIVMMKTIT